MKKKVFDAHKIYLMTKKVFDGHKINLMSKKKYLMVTKSI